MADSGRLNMELIEPQENLGWIRSINTGLERSADSKYVCFQNDDTIFTEGWLEELVDIFEKDPQVGIANPEWEKPADLSAGEYAPKLKKYKGQTIDIDWCRGHCFFVRREVVEKIGGFDMVYLPVYYDDRDYSLKAIKAGYRCVKAKGAFVDHIRNVTMKKAMEQEKINALMERNGRVFYKRWGYPLKLIFVLNDIKSSGELLRNVCMDQNKVIVIKKARGALPYEHTNLKVLEFGPFLFNVKTLFYIMTKRSKKHQKGIDYIFTNDDGFYSFTKLFRSFVTAQIIFGANMNDLSEIAVGLIRVKKEKDKSAIRV
jgi:glycosyltransferase involved in cell wall biosynthesis